MSGYNVESVLIKAENMFDCEEPNLDQVFTDLDTKCDLKSKEEVSLQKKCGDIFLNESDAFVIVCTCCSVFYSNFEDFTSHFIESFKNSNLQKDNVESFEPKSLTVEKDSQKINIKSNDEDTDENTEQGDIPFVNYEEDDDEIPISKLILASGNKKKRSSLNTISEINNDEHTEIMNSDHDDDLDEVDSDSINMKKKKEERPFKCTLCKRSFKVEASLEVHELIHQSTMVGDNNYKCVICEKELNHKSYVRHLQLFHRIGARIYECGFCDKKFLHNAEKSIHERYHTGEKPFLCTLCGKSFTTSCRLAEHNRRHNGIKPYKCQFCPKTFVAKLDQIDHERTHTGERPFQCKICNATFPRRNALRRHINLHSDIAKYVCKVCGKSFKQDCSLYKHMRNQKHR